MTQCYVDLDSGCVEVPEDQPTLPFYDELKHKIQHAYKKYKNAMSQLNSEDSIDVAVTPPLKKPTASSKPPSGLKNIKESIAGECDSFFPHIPHLSGLPPLRCFIFKSFSL